MLVRDIQQYEETDSDLAKYTISTQQRTIQILEAKNDELFQKMDEIYRYIDDECIIKDDDGTIHLTMDELNMLHILKLLRK